MLATQTLPIRYVAQIHNDAFPEIVDDSADAKKVARVNAVTIKRPKSVNDNIIKGANDHRYYNNLDLGVR